MATIVLTVVGDDRPGLVSDLSAPILAHGGNWERSQMARLAGKYAGVVLVTVEGEKVSQLVVELQALEAQGLYVSVERTDVPPQRSAVMLTLDLLGADHPGIVAEITACLAARSVSIEELITTVREAPMAGGNLFEGHAMLSAPSGTDMHVLRSALESLADELMVEITLSRDPEHP